MDHPKNRGSYIINSEPITKDQVGLWAARLESLGIDQIDFHQGYPFRQGDSYFLPAALGEYAVEGDGSLILSGV